MSDFRYRNKKNGKTYDVLWKNVTDETNVMNKRIVYVYADIDIGKVYVREEREFLEKFELIEEKSIYSEELLQATILENIKLKYKIQMLEERGVNK
jgi:hypothetical protein